MDPSIGSSTYFESAVTDRRLDGNMDTNFCPLFSRNLSLDAENITISNNQHIKFLMDQPLDLSQLGDGSQDNVLYFENINLYADGAQFRFDGKGSWVGNGYVVSLPDWVPDGDLVFLPHTQIARIEGSSGRISTLKLVPDSQETITLNIDRDNGQIDQDAPI